MKIPGFTAEASLYKTDEYYHMIGAANQVDGAIQLAQIGSIPFPIRCIPGCLIACNRCKQQFGLQGNCIARCCFPWPQPL